MLVKMFKELKKTILKCEASLSRGDYGEVFYELSQERMEERHLKEGYMREFNTMIRILTEYSRYLSIVAHNTALARTYKENGKGYRQQEKDAREKAKDGLKFLRGILDQLAVEIKKLKKESRKG
jgi:hypothetical protein